MNIYPEGWWIFPRREISTWRARDDRVVSGKNSFPSTCAFLRVLRRYVATRNPSPPLPPPFSKGDYFLLICITPRPTKGARDRPCHCNVNKLRLPDLLPRGGHASSFVIAPPLSLVLMPRPRPAAKHFSPIPAFRPTLSLSPLPRPPPSPSMTITVYMRNGILPSSIAIYFHVAILRSVISVVKLEFSASYRGETM